MRIGRPSSCWVARLFAALIGCKPAEPPSSTAEEPGTVLDDARLLVTVEHAGTEPRRELRLVAPVGTREESVVTVATTMTPLDGTTSIDGQLPVVSYLVDIVLEQIDNDTRRYGLLVGLLPSADAADILARGRMVTDDRGRPLEFELDFSGPDGKLVPLEAVRTSPHARVLADLPRRLLPLPAEPVGVGARWTIAENTVEGGIDVTMTSHYELVALQPDGADIRVTTSSRVEGNEFTEPGASGPVKFNELDVSGERTASIAFARVLPSQDGSITTELDIQQGSERMALRTRETTKAQPLERSPFALFASEAAAIGSFTDGSVAPCKSLRGDREGRFPSEPNAALVTGECKGGQPVGTWTTLHDDGKTKRLEGRFDAGTPVGRWTQWTAEGKELGSFELERGTGTVVEWWPDGKKRLDIGFRAGKPHGAFTTWRTSGEPEMRGRFHDGRRDGRWERLDASGKVVDSVLHDHGCRLVTGVVPDSPAEHAGIREDDVVIAIGAVATASSDDLHAELARLGDRPVTIVVDRNGKRTESKTKVELDAGKLGIHLTCSVRRKR